MTDYSKAHPAPAQRRVLSGGRAGTNVNTVDLHRKGITILSETVDGHRVFTLRHRDSGLSATGRSIQAAYDELVGKL